MPRTGSPISIEKLSNTLQRITSDPMTLSACAIRNLHTAEAFVSFYGIRELSESRRGLPKPVLILRVPGGQEIGSDDVEVSFRDGFSVAVSADPDGLVPSFAGPVSLTLWVMRMAPQAVRK